MSYTFDEIMAYHPDNINVYQEIRKYLPRLIPFVGAGLTQFAYCSWPGTLKELSGKLTDKRNQKKVKDLIKGNQYLDAAQLLEAFRTPTNLARDLAILFSADKLEENREKLQKQAISLLPCLFSDLVLTTNFDETLETVYRESGRPFHRVLLPGHPGLLRQFIRQGGSRGLFKLHGSLTGDLIEYDKIVFTQRQYDEHYGENSSLTKELKECFENRMLFFLGCSLENDRTMEVLQEVRRPGDSYYTVINCKKSERDQKIGQLGVRGIRAIVYEGNRHEAVRVILEHLLEETDPDAYQALPCHIGALKSADLSERFSYKAEIVPFTGREHEMEELNAFLKDSSTSFRWWAVIGPGGSGKSRLAYEFQKQLPPDWAVHYLEPGDYGKLSDLTERLTRKTLLIADYVQENAKALGKWMEQLQDTKRSLPVRVLLVERDSGTGQEDFAWTRQLYADVYHEHKLRNACYREAFLTLQPLPDDDLLAIIGEYGAALKRNRQCGDSALPDTVRQSLLGKLKSVDPGLCRPLYGMFLTDACVNGSDPQKWSRNDILDYVTRREQKRLQFQLQQILGKEDEKLYETCLHLQSMATVLQDAPAEELQRLCPGQWEILAKKADCFASPLSMLERAGLMTKGKFSALRPDLIGEYFVFTWLLRHQEEAQPFLEAAWKKPGAAFVFFDRMFRDYHYLLNENGKHWELLLPGGIFLDEDTAVPYAMLLANATYYCKIVGEIERQVKLLSEISFRYPEDIAITVILAKSLVNLSSEQDEAGARETLERLEKLTEEHPDEVEMAVMLAQGLFNLSNEQDEKGAGETLERLEKLTEEHPDEIEIAVILAKGLFNLSNKQDEKGARETLKRLEKLTERYPDEIEIAVRLAKGLFNLSNEQDEKGAGETLERLEKLTERYPDEIEITVILAKGLVNLSNKQEETGAKETLERLEKLTERYPDEIEIKIELTKGLVNLSSKQEETGAKETLERLEKLTEEHPDEIEIKIELAKGLFNLSNEQDEKGAEETLERLEKLTERYPDEIEIAVILAKGLFNLSVDQDEKGAKEMLERLEHLAAGYPDEPEIAVVLAKGLINFGFAHGEAGAKEVFECLGRLNMKHPKIFENVNKFIQRFLNSLDTD